MLSTKLSDCTFCQDIICLINDIDCKVSRIGVNIHNNNRFALGKKIPDETLFSLLQYKRILHYKYINSEYADISLDKIFDKVRKLLLKN